MHSAELDANGDPVDHSSFYHKFIHRLRADWDIVDEGPMVDLLAIEVRANNDGSLTLHQSAYVKKLLARFLPNGPSDHPDISRSTLPWSKDLRRVVEEAIADPNNTPAHPAHPELVSEMQQRCGALLYLATSTRADLAFVVPYLCRVMSCPTPDIIHETNHIFVYLHRHPDVGLTPEPGKSKLTGFSDASWEVRHSTSGWVIFWQNAAIAWRSKKQESIALSSCEAEIIALSEATKDVVYFRKLIAGIDGPAISGPTDLSTDNMGARALAYNPEFHDKSKHVERRHFFVRDMVEKFEVNVPFVRSADNWADFFTKPLEPKQFFALRKVVMNEPRILSG